MSEERWEQTRTSVLQNHLEKQPSINVKKNVLSMKLTISNVVAGGEKSDIRNLHPTER